MVTRNLFCLYWHFFVRKKESEIVVFCAGSGEVDFEEFYDWWTSDKESSVLKKAQDGNQKDYEIEPY